MSNEREQSIGGENFRLPQRRRQNLTDIQYLARKDMIDEARNRDLLQYLTPIQRMVSERLYSEAKPLSPQELAHELNVSRQAISSTEKLLFKNVSQMLETGKEVSRGKPSKIKEEFGEGLEDIVRNLYEIQRLFAYQIARELKVSTPTVRRMIKRYNLRRPRVENYRIVPMPDSVGESILDLGLDRRTCNSLARAGKFKVEEVSNMSDEELLSLRGFGKKSLIELREKLENYKQNQTNIY